MKLVQQLHTVPLGGFADGPEHMVAEFIRGSSGNKDGRGLVPGLHPVLLQHSRRHSGVGVNEVAVLLIILGDGFRGPRLVAEAAPELLPEGRLDSLRNLILPAGVQGLHIAPDFRVVLPGEVEQQPLQVAGHQNVHRGTHGGVEGPVFVVHAGAEEIRQHVVFIGRADELPYRQAHALRVIRRQDIPEVAGGDAEVHLVPHVDLPVPEQVAVGGDVVNHLGQDAAPVDGVGGGQEIAPLRQGLPDALVGEYALHPRLGVVEVAHHGADANILPVLGDHLGLLDLGHAVLGVEDHDFRLSDIGKALHGGLAGVAGGGHQNADRLVLPGLPQGGGKELRQHLEGHVLKGGGGAVPQLQAVGGAVHLPQGGGGGVAVLIGTVGVIRKAQQLFLAVIRQIKGHDLGGPLLVGGPGKAFQKGLANLGNGLRGQQPAVPGKAQLHGLGPGHPQGTVSGAQILHVSYLTFLVVFWNLCKGVLQVLHPERAVLSLINLRHVEAGGAVQAVKAHVKIRGPAEALLFPPVHKFPGQPDGAGAPALCLHKAEDALGAAGHNVQLPEAAAPLAV